LMWILPYRAPDSTVSGTLVTFLDVTTIVQAEQHHRLLVDELNHRVKNMLTVVISLAAQTLRRSATLETFSDAFMGRMRALTASYSLLTDRNWSNVSLRDVLAVESNPYVAPDRVNITMEGPDVRLGPAGALALGMTTHELLTNAVKYGALSAAEGSVAITWHIEPRNDREELVLEWVEEYGPTLEAPAARGFGTTLIQRSFAHDLGGDATLDFDVKGVRATPRAPLGALITTVPSAETRTQK
jgi:two-component system, chemotaxis family, CheB/CheR fusion protein